MSSFLPKNLRWILTIIVICGLMPQVRAAGYPMPSIVSRTDWGCPDGEGSSKGTPTKLNSISHIFVHHSDSSNSSSDWKKVVLAIWKKHRSNIPGWGSDFDDIGYNYLIDPNGAIYEGRSGGLSGVDDMQGEHTYGYNSHSMGVCLLGTFNSSSPTEAALASLKELMAWKCDQRGIAPTKASTYPGRDAQFNISGHRDTNVYRRANNLDYTECPGESLYALLSSIRADVKTKISNFHSSFSVPTVRTLSADRVTANSIRFRGVIESTGNLSITGRRFDFGSSTPLSDFTEVTQTSGNEFYHTITGLSPGTTVKFRAWAKNSNGWAYGNILSATTTASGDGAPPEISTFKVTPTSIPLGGEVTISCTVSDSGGSGLNRVELWRATSGGGSNANWIMIQQKTASGSGAITKSFTDSPASTGSYWYGIHVVDGAGNLANESYGNFEPVRVTVSSAGSARVVPLTFYVDDDMEGASSGNADGVPNPGERLEIDLDWKNIGTADADECLCKIATSDPYITIPDDDIGASSIAAGETKSSGDFDVTVLENCPDMHVVTFDVVTRWNGGQENGTFQIIVRRLPFTAIPNSPVEGQSASFPITFSWSAMGAPPSTLRLVFWDGNPARQFRLKPVQGTESIVSLQEWMANIAPSYPGSTQFKWSLGYLDGGGTLRALTPWITFRPVTPPTSSVTLTAPSDGVGLALPTTFQWSIQGTAPPNLRIVFSDSQSGGKVVWKPVSGTSDAISADEWRFGVAPNFPVTSQYYWSIGFQDDTGELRALTPWRGFIPNLPPSAVATLVSPSVDLELVFPATFRWTVSNLGSNSLKLVFRNGSSPSQIRMKTVAGTESTISSDEWMNQVGVHLPAGTSYQWAVGYTDEDGKLRIMTPWRAFSTNVGDGFSLWSVSNNLSGADSLKNADPDHDGLNNLLEYALGSNPTIHSIESLPSFARGQGAEVNFTFTRVPTRPDVTYTVEMSEDLNHWTAIARSVAGAPSTFVGPVTGQISESGSTNCSVVVHIDAPTGQPVFMRLNVSRE